MSSISHSYAICAYKESPFLEACIQSLLAQTIPSQLLLVTSTPNDHIQSLAQRYQIPLHINTGEAGITQDWNFAYQCAQTDLVTLAHQDDIYSPIYTQEIMKLYEKARHPLILFTDYGELRNDEKVEYNSLLRVKRLMLAPLRIRAFHPSVFVRRRILSLGCPICCPAVTFVKPNLPSPVFRAGFRSDEDWEAWEMLSRRRGSFCYSKAIGMYHRIHEGSETSAIIQDNGRSAEDYQMFRKFWPSPIAAFLTKLYARSQNSNQL